MGKSKYRKWKILQYIIKQRFTKKEVYTATNWFDIAKRLNIGISIVVYNDWKSIIPKQFLENIFVYKFACYSLKFTVYYIELSLNLDA